MEIRDSELRQGPDGTSRTCESRDSIQTSLSGVTADGSRSYGEWSTGEEVWGCQDLRGIVGMVPTVLTLYRDKTVCKDKWKNEDMLHINTSGNVGQHKIPSVVCWCYDKFVS